MKLVWRIISVFGVKKLEPVHGLSDSFSPLAATICKPQNKRGSREGGNKKMKEKRKRKKKRRWGGKPHKPTHTKKSNNPTTEMHISPMVTFLEWACPEIQKRKDKVREMYGAQDKAEHKKKKRNK